MDRSEFLGYMTSLSVSEQDALNGQEIWISGYNFSDPNTTKPWISGYNFSDPNTTKPWINCKPTVGTIYIDDNAYRNFHVYKKLKNGARAKHETYLYGGVQAFFTKDEAIAYYIKSIEISMEIHRKFLSNVKQIYANLGLFYENTVNLYGPMIKGGEPVGE